MLVNHFYSFFLIWWFVPDCVKGKFDYDFLRCIVHFAMKNVSTALHFFDYHLRRCVYFAIKCTKNCQKVHCVNVGRNFANIHQLLFINTFCRLLLLKTDNVFFNAFLLLSMKSNIHDHIHSTSLSLCFINYIY